MNGLAHWILSSDFHRFMAANAFAYTAAETLHFMGLCVLFGGLAAIDLRGLGLLKAVPLASMHKLVPWVIGAFLVNLATGICFIFFEPTGYFGNWAFQTKMVLIVAAGLNALAFELMVFRPLQAGRPVEGGAAIRITSGLSLLLWGLVLVAGRTIAYA